MVTLEKYIWNILVSLDQLANTLLGGDPDMTISGRVGRWYPNSDFRQFIDLIFGKNHCKDQAIKEADEGKDAIIK
ncbi:MAG: hypothetical protein NT007_09615 [Candidatus Kapabacteria bacterium]|nr:hypothetical protein [Candidatus Kapabacteria bacterium]